MDIRTLTDAISVSPQIEISDLAQIKERGFATIICNRPDGESEDQPNAHDIAAEADAIGIDFVDIPISPGEFTAVQMLAFLDATMRSPGPILAYCRTGTRSATLWALSSAKTLSAQDIIQTAKEAGYDLSNLKPRLRELA